MDFSVHKPVCLKFSQLLRQHLFADRRNRLPQPAEPAWCRAEFADDVQLPLAGDHLYRGCKTILGGFVHLALLTGR